MPAQYITAFETELQQHSDNLATASGLPHGRHYRVAFGLAWRDAAADAALFPVMGAGDVAITLINDPDGIIQLDEQGGRSVFSVPSSEIINTEKVFITRQTALLGNLFQEAHARLAGIPARVRYAAEEALAHAVCRLGILVAANTMQEPAGSCAYHALHRSFADLAECLTLWDLADLDTVSAVMRLYRRTGLPWAIAADPVRPVG